MSVKKEAANVTQLPIGKNERLVLNEEGLSAAKKSLDQGAVTPSYGPWREDIVKLLNDALATELVCVMRYKRHHFTAKGLASPKIAEEFMVHALILGGSGNPAVDRKVGQETLDFGGSHLPGVALAVEEDEAANPLDVGILRADAVVLEPDAVSHLIQEAGLGWQHGQSP